MNKRFDRGYLLVLAICFLAVWPFISRASLPAHTDTELHIYRLAELLRMWEGGVIYPRWAANFYYGYGYPIFNYYAPLAYYVGLLITLLPGIGVVGSVKTVFVLSTLGAAVGMYGFVRDNWGKPAAWTATAAYIYAPYLQFIDPHARGVLPETASFAIFSLALWSLDRLRKQPTAPRFVTATLLLAAIITTHNLMAFIMGPLLFVWTMFHLTRSPHSGRVWAVLIAAFTLGVALAAFFWLPMVAEQNAIKINTVIGAGSHYDFNSHFLTFRELLSPSQRIDWRASAAAYHFNLGIVQWGVALLAIFMGKRGQHAFYSTTAAVLILLMLPIASPIWDTLPLLPYLQFPWRLLGVTAAMLAILCGIFIHRFPRLAPIVIALILLCALPLTHVPPWGDFGKTDALTVVVHELQGDWLGTTSTADFVPTTVDNLSVIDETVSRDLIEGRTPDWLNRATLGDTAVTAETITPVHTRYIVDAPDPLTMRFYRFAFPGWTATIDGEPAALGIAKPEGWLTLSLPAGQYTVDLRFGTTPPRTWGWVITALAAVTVVFVAGALSRTRTVIPDTTPLPNDGRTPIFLTVAAITLAHIFVIAPSGILRWQSDTKTAAPATTDTAVNYNDQFSLIGYTAPATLKLGRDLPVDLYWQAIAPQTDNVQVFVQLRPLRDGISYPHVTQSTKPNPGDYPTERWTPDKYVLDAHKLAIPAELTPGIYELTAGLWHQFTTQAILPVAGTTEEWVVLAYYEVR